MLPISIDPELKRLHPRSALGCLQGLACVGPSPAGLEAELTEICAAIGAQLKIEDIARQPHIADTRTAYKAFGKDPARYRCSCEAMMRRCVQGKGLYRVNSLVDINNLVSLRSGLSIGLYDTTRIEGPVVWSVAAPECSYTGIGKDALNLQGLPVLSDAAGPFGNPSSDSERTRITEATGSFLLAIFSFSGAGALPALLDQTAALVARYASGSGFSQWILE